MKKMKESTFYKTAYDGASTIKLYPTGLYGGLVCLSDTWVVFIKKLSLLEECTILYGRTMPPKINIFLNKKNSPKIPVHIG